MHDAPILTTFDRIELHDEEIRKAITPLTCYGIAVAKRLVQNRRMSRLPVVKQASPDPGRNAISERDEK